MRETTEQLAAVALLGTGRGGKMPAAPGPIGAALSAAEARTGVGAERALLDAAAIALACGRAGLVAREAPAAAEPAPEDDLPLCSPGAAQVLARLLGGESPEVIPQWLTHATDSGVRAPHELLVPLFEAARRERTLRETVQRVAGERGRWLARLNPDWRFAGAARPDLSRADEQWQTGTAEDRLALLRDVREHDPALGRSLVESTWATDPPELRVKFVDLFAIGLSMEDEPFLEERLDDKRKGVRTAAASLLGRLPESRLIARMIERTAGLLSYEAPRGMLKRSKPRLVVTLPKERDPGMTRDGIEDVPTQGKGKRTFLLAQMLNLIPPRLWLSKFDASSIDMVRAALQSDEKEMLLRSFLNATMMFKDGEFARALLEEWVLPGLPDLMEGLDAITAIEPVAEREQFVVAVLNRRTIATHGLWWLLHAMRHPWSLEFSRSLESHFATEVKVRRKEEILAAMTVAALHLHPAALAPMIAGVERHFAEERSKQVDALIATMHMRHACWKEFEHP